MNKPFNKMWGFFVLVVFTIMFIFSLFTILLFLIMRHLNLVTLHGPSPFSPLVMYIIISILIGSIITLIIGKTVLNPVNKLIIATKIVAKGDFNVKLSEKHFIKEIGEMSVNFNKMVLELKSIESFRNDFILNVSHEFKNPLASIEGYTALLQDTDLSKNEHTEYIQMIIGSVTQLSTMTSNILKLSKLENQEIKKKNNRFHLDEQIRQAYLLLEPSWSAKNIEVEMDLASIIIEGNEELLFQVWVNLIDNAIKFSPKNSTLEIFSHTKAHAIAIQIKDYGVGMDEPTKKRIFEKFFQGNTSHTDEGSGLGLAIVSRIIALHNGQIAVDSTKDEGTTFVVTLPYL